MRTFLQIVLFFTSSLLFSQSNFKLSDQEYHKLHNKSRLLINANPDSSFIVATIIEKSNNNLHKSFAYGIKSYLYQLKDDSLKSKQFYKQAFTYLDKLPETNEKTKLHAYLLNYGGLAEWKRGNLSKALLRYNKGLQFSEKIDDVKQVVKFNNNISSIHKDAGNYDLGISILKRNDILTDKYEYLFEVDEFYNIKSLLNLNLGDNYSNLYMHNLNKNILLDSSAFFYKKAIIFSKYIESLKISAQKGLAYVYFLQKDYDKSLKEYNKLQLLTKRDAFNNSGVNYALGQIYFETKKYDKSLFHFIKVDSIYKENKENIIDYIPSNYYQAKIYAQVDDFLSASKHSKIYLDEFKKNESTLNKEILGVSNILNTAKVNEEMVAIQKDHQYDGLIKYGLILLLLVIFIALFIRNNKAKNKAIKKVKLLVEEFKKQEALSLVSTPEEVAINNELISTYNENAVKSVLILDVEKENHILKQLNVLEQKKEYLKEDFTQQYVAKKIKTNTTYLSYVINKNFNKTFSEYSNELKINYVISQLINNATYRKYSTQAIAESVGFKNATSFTKSFHKKTGVTPVQFAKSLQF